MAYTNFTNCTAEQYKDIVYNQETHNKIKILFNNVELEDADEYCESFEVQGRVIPTGSKTFMLDNLVSVEAELTLHNIDTSIIQDQISIYIGTVVGSNSLGDIYEYVPIGIFNLQEKPTTDAGKTTIKLRDNSIKLDFNYNAKPLIDLNGGSATKKQILDDICSQAGITSNVSSFLGDSDAVGIYDNTVKGRQYVCWIAEQAGALPIITRSGALDFVYINNLTTNTIPIDIVEKYENGDNFKISRVVYEDGIRKYEYGSETNDTLFLDTANPYISNQERIESIHSIANNFEINSFETGRILGNPAIDYYDLIQIHDKSKNLFDKDNVNFYANNSSAFSNTTDTNKTRVRTASFNIDDYGIETNTNYVVSGMPNGWSLLGVGTFTSPSATNTSASTTSGATFKITDNNIKYIYLLFGNNSSTSVASQSFRDGNIQIEEGNNPTSFEKYYDYLFTTFANNKLRYNGKLINTFDSKISLERKKENVSLNSTPTFKRWAKTEIDNANAQITIQAGQIETIEQDLQNPTSTKEGKYFDLEDALDSPLIDFSMEGQTQQDSTTGKNLFDKTNNLFQGSFLTSSGGNNSVDSSNVRCCSKKIDISGKSGNLTFSGQHFELMSFYDSNNAFISYSNNSTTTIPSGATSVRLRFFNNENQLLVSTLQALDLMLESGSTATSFEPYTNGASPNPSYPQPIHNVSGDNYLTICGKNIYNTEIFNGTFNQTTYKIFSNILEIKNNYSNISRTIDTNTNYFKMTLTNTYDVSQNWHFKNLLPNTQYTISCNVNINKADGTVWLFVGNKSYNTTQITAHFTTDANGEKSFSPMFYMGGTKAVGDYVELSNIQLEKGNQAPTQYEAYTGNSQLISLGVENLYNPEQTLTQGQYVDSTFEQNNNRVTSDYIPIKVGETYTISCDLNNLQDVALINYNLFDSNKNWLGNRTTNGDDAFSGQKTHSFKVNLANTKYVRITFRRYSDASTSLPTTIVENSLIQLEKGSKANSYTPYGTTPIKLCKIGNYEDRPFKADNDDDFYKTLDSATKQTLTYGKWYLHKEIDKVVLNGSEEWGLANNVFYKSNNKGLQQTGIKIVKSNYFQEAYNQPSTSNVNIYNSDNSICGSSVGTNRFYIKCTSITSTENFKTWLSTHNTIVYYVLATPTNTEITDTTLLEQLNNLMTLPLYKNLTHITLTPNDLQPTMKIEYFRDTSINENFVSKEDMTKYYTRKETDAQILINSSSIQQSVSELQETTNGNTGAITTLSNQVNTLQTSTSLQINAINEQLEDGVSKVKTTTGYTLDGNGLSITKGQGFSSLTTDRYQKIEYNNKELSFMGYDDTLNKPISRIEELEARKITTGVHRTETIQEDGEKWTAQYYVGGGN